MRPRHGKPKSECCQARVIKSANGEWTEFECQKCGVNTDADGRLYRYVLVDPSRASAPP